MSYDQDQRRRTYGLAMLPFPGLTIDMRKPGFTALDALTRAVLVLGGDFDGRDVTPDVRMDAWRDLFTAFADSLVAWDLTDRGRAVPVTREGVLAQDPQFLLELVRTWYAVVVLAPPEHTAIEQPADEELPPAQDDEDAEVLDDYLANIPTTTLPEPAPAGPALAMTYPEVGTEKLGVGA